MTANIENDFAKFFQFLEAQDLEVQLYSEAESDESIKQIERFVLGEIKSEDEKNTFFTMIRNNPQLLQELLSRINQKSDK
ncbi:hypothetical protein MLD52_15475 [Puniceicoccaceae bacterium K14]|nr:hypothetical protein [Puniceicoccaceae bacterium K14]